MARPAWSRTDAWNVWEGDFIRFRGPVRNPKTDKVFPGIIQGRLTDVERLPAEGFVRVKLLDLYGKEREYQLSDRTRIARRVPPLRDLVRQLRQTATPVRDVQGWYVVVHSKNTQWVQPKLGGLANEAVRLRPLDAPYLDHGQAVKAAAWADQQFPGEFVSIETASEVNIWRADPSIARDHGRGIEL